MPPLIIASPGMTGYVCHVLRKIHRAAISFLRPSRGAQIKISHTGPTQPDASLTILQRVKLTLG